jgi:type IV pilus assembly protein PilM
VRVPLVYHNGPLLGFDLGNRTAKLAQLEKRGKDIAVIGYGSVNFPTDTIIEGIISDPETLAKAIKPLLSKATGGKLTARKVAASLPVAKSFIRTLLLPTMSSSDLTEAVRLEAEQYVPIPLGDLYLDYEIIEQIPAVDSKPAQLNILMVAAPRAIVNSYIQLFDALGLEIDSLEVSLASITRAMLLGNASSNTSLVADFGSQSTDLAIFDRVIRLTGSVAVGGDAFTATLVKSLGITPDQANEIKYKFGIGKSGLQPKIIEALTPQLKSIVSEMKKVVKYYQDRNDKQPPISQIILSGGSASMPGLAEFLQEQVGLTVVLGNPWSQLQTKHVATPRDIETPMYTTAIGLALREVQRD